MAPSSKNSSVSLSRESQSQIDSNSALLLCLQNIDRNLFDANRILVETVIPAAQTLAEQIKECDFNTEFLERLFVAADLAEEVNDSTDIDTSTGSEQSHVSDTAKLNAKRSRYRSLE